MEKSKQALVGKSGIPELKEYLEKYAAEYLEKRKTIDGEEFLSLLGEVKGGLQTLRVEKERQKKKIIEKVKKDHQPRKSAWKQVYDYFSAQKRKLEELRVELRELGGSTSSGILMENFWKKYL